MQETTPDLTRIIDPAELWPDPASTPDWPLFPDEYSRSMNGPRTRKDAESRLYSLSRELHGNAVPRDPTVAERTAAHERLFGVPTHANFRDMQFQALGLPFRAANHSVEAQARAVVEAAHIRGWLRKLDAAEVAARVAKERAETASLRDKAEGWPAREAATLAKLQPLLEGEKRHLQRIEDERAFHRARDLRQALDWGHREAVEAARRLGVDLPAAPEVEEALTL